MSVIPYKEVPPEDTINRITKILSGLNIKVSKVPYGKDGLSNSVRLVISNNNLCRLNIGTNGKGLTHEYALASACGELMERMENKMLFFYVPGDFRYFPDEEYRTLTPKEFTEWGRILLPLSSQFDPLPERQCYEIPFVPFYNVVEHKVESLPYSLIRLASSSTGLCAGNTPAEAILQGLNEIFERYVLQRLYLDDVRLPNVSLECFSGSEIYDRILRLQQMTGWRVYVKDCSLKRGFPVVGLLVIDDRKGKYTFRLGADLSPEIALQRCFTEIFQGTGVDDSAFLPIDFSDDKNWKVEYERNVVNGRGHFKYRIFFDAAENNSIDYKFNITSSFNDNLRTVTHWLSGKGYTLYVRDNSFLGFPAYHLYVPGLSDVDEGLFNIGRYLHTLESRFYIKPEFRLMNISKMEIGDVIERLKYEESVLTHLFPYSWNRYSSFNRNLLLSMLSYMSGDFDSASGFMNEFLNYSTKTGNRQNAYYYCVRDYFNLQAQKLPLDEVKKSLNLFYGIDTAGEVFDDFSESQSVLSNIPLPQCFECFDCQLASECAYKEVLEIENIIRREQKNNPVNQNSIADVFAG